MMADPTPAQMTPIQVERYLQQRPMADEEREPTAPHFDDDSLRAAVARLTSHARQTGIDVMVRTEAEWEISVGSHLDGPDVTGWVQEMMEPLYRHAVDAQKRGETAPDLPEFNVWLGLLTNIWNNATQPDRDGLTARQLSRVSTRR